LAATIASRYASGFDGTVVDVLDVEVLDVDVELLDPVDVDVVPPVVVVTPVVLVDVPPAVVVVSSVVVGSVVELVDAAVTVVGGVEVVVCADAGLGRMVDAAVRMVAVRMLMSFIGVLRRSADRRLIRG
jgi:hypothetical protein